MLSLWDRNKRRRRAVQRESTMHGSSVETLQWLPDPRRNRYISGVNAIPSLPLGEAITQRRKGKQSGCPQGYHSIKNRLFREYGEQVDCKFFLSTHRFLRRIGNVDLAHWTRNGGGCPEKTKFKLKSKNSIIALMSINVNKLQNVLNAVIGH